MSEQQSMPKWSDPIESIPEERQSALRQLAEAQRAWVAATGSDRDPIQSPFARIQLTGGTRLTGADVFFLATNAIATEHGIAMAEAERRVRDTATWALLGSLRLEGADLRFTHLEGANLFGSHLEGADFTDAHLEHANLFASHLEDSNLQRAHLGNADLRRVFISRGTFLEFAVLADNQHVGPSVADVRWQEVNLAIIQQWGNIAMLGDELWARQLETKPLLKGASRVERRKVRAKRHEKILDAWREAERANVQLATVMRDQGMSNEADHFAYRAQLCQRESNRVQGKHLRRFGSWLLDLVSGYGYKPLRSVIAYVLIIALFAGLYLLNGQFAAPHLSWDEAMVLSISSFHGRGFFSSGISLGDTLARLAAGEAIIGLLIEITFIATFTQRFFAR
jgi:uncharacterized protein YjbI with pentapeptide repeats